MSLKKEVNSQFFESNKEYNSIFFYSIFFSAILVILVLS